MDDVISNIGFSQFYRNFRSSYLTYFIMRPLFLFLLLVTSLVVSAHGDIHERINKLTAQIKEQPNNPELYLKRGQLYYQHQEYGNAEKDYLKVQQLAPDSAEVYYWKAVLYLDMERIDDGIVAAETCLKQRPNDVKALRTYAKLLLQANRPADAVKPFQKLIAFAEGTLPENYLELSAVFVQLDEDTLAIAWLQKGIADLGPVFTLKDALLILYKDAGMYNEAIAEYTLLAQNSARKETYYYEIAELYLAQHNNEQAQTYLQKARIALQSLPWHLQMTDAMKELSAAIEMTQQKI